jgi:hypothetical protein
MSHDHWWMGLEAGWVSGRTTKSHDFRVGVPSCCLDHANRQRIFTMCGIWSALDGNPGVLSTNIGRHFAVTLPGLPGVQHHRLARRRHDQYGVADLRIDEVNVQRLRPEQGCDEKQGEPGAARNPESRNAGSEFLRRSPATYELKPRQEDPGSNEPGIRLGSMRRIKGLEFRAVAMACSDPADVINRKDGEATDRCQRYVAASRAREHLLVMLANADTAPSP